MPVSDDTILRQLKRRVAARCGAVTVRVAGIDDWSWRRGCSYGTIVVDLERRVVVDVLADRSAAGTADWLRAHPEVEMISRDRSGLYAQGGREGAPQARQIADRFHLFQNLRESIEAQLSRVDRPTGCALLPSSKDEDESAATIVSNPRGQSDVAKHRKLTRQAQRRSRQAIYDQIRTLRDAGTSIRDIAKETGFCMRSVRKWLKFSAPPERRAAEPTPCSPNYFLTYLSGRWAEGCVRGRQLFQEIKLRGYTGSFSHLERLLATWRGDRSAKAAKNNNDHTVVTSPPNPQPPTESASVTIPRAVDRATGWVVSGPASIGSTTLRSPADRKARRHPWRQTPHQALALPSASADREIAG
jgi:hypothetical protein